MRLLVPFFLAACAVPRPAPLTAVQRETLEIEGRAAYDRKEWHACAERLEQAGSAYDAACCHALDGNPDRAFALLHEEIRSGEDWRFLDHWRSDPDLTAVRNDPRWAELMRAATARYEAYRAGLNAELLQLYEDDQADRRLPYDQIDWPNVSARDRAREARVDAILRDGGAKTTDDYYHAAMVYQHGTTPAQAARARDLAREAVKLDPHNRRARWLAAAAEDRRLMYENKPQRYGTQFRRVDGVWVLYDTDPSVTDEERAEWNVPSLARARARAAEMNRPKD